MPQATFQRPHQKHGLLESGGCINVREVLWRRAATSKELQSVFLNSMLLKTRSSRNASCRIQGPKETTRPMR